MQTLCCETRDKLSTSFAIRMLLLFLHCIQKDTKIIKARDKTLPDHIVILELCSFLPARASRLTEDTHFIHIE